MIIGLLGIGISGIAVAGALGFFFFVVVPIMAIDGWLKAGRREDRKRAAAKAKPHRDPPVDLLSARPTDITFGKS